MLVATPHNDHDERDWRRGHYWRAVNHFIGAAKQVGFEFDQLCVYMYGDLQSELSQSTLFDIAQDTMQQRMTGSEEEIDLKTKAANIADIGVAAIRDLVKPGMREKADVNPFLPNVDGLGLWSDELGIKGVCINAFYNL